MSLLLSPITNPRALVCIYRAMLSRSIRTVQIPNPIVPRISSLKTPRQHINAIIKPHRSHPIQSTVLMYESGRRLAAHQPSSPSCSPSLTTRHLSFQQSHTANRPYCQPQPHRSRTRSSHSPDTQTVTLLRRCRPSPCLHPYPCQSRYYRHRSTARRRNPRIAQKRIPGLSGSFVQLAVVERRCSRRNGVWIFGRAPLSMSPMVAGNADVGGDVGVAPAAAI